jgi:hypothetical protein
LHVAARLGRIDMAALLLARGADVNAVAETGTPLDVAYEAAGANRSRQIQLRQDQVIALLKDHGAQRASQPQREAAALAGRKRSDTSGSCR